ncbi:MAG: 2-dehydropantoate 2-reductase [Candidatus Thermoplasmatota archaeon]|nr:2-dehydropantoate 2-reductase [Candidatus Thermoplasmatota archaeon]
MVYGAGALGSFVGGMLSRQHMVTLVGRREHMTAVRRRGLHISGTTELVVHPAAATALPDRGADLVILTVKAYDTVGAARDIHASCDAPVLSLQNGLDNERTLSEIHGKRRVIGGVTSHGIRYIGPGRIAHTGLGDTVIGELDGTMSERVEAIAQALSDCGIATATTGAIWRELWRKAIVNAAINPVTALLRCPNGFLLENEGTRRLMRDVCDEGIAVAGACNIDVGSVFEQAELVARRTASNHSSMLQSIQRGRPTEIEHINGVIVSCGEKHGVATPVNETLTRLVRALEKEAAVAPEGIGQGNAAEDR